MKQTINFEQFYDAFMRVRPNYFSYEGLKALYDYLEQLEEDTGIEMELDVIALCCEFREMSYGEVISYYLVYNDIWYDLLEIKDTEEMHRMVLEWLQKRTTVLEVEDDRVIIQEF